METRTYLGVDAINAISAACVDFSYSELRTITDYSYGCGGSRLTWTPRGT